MGKKFFWWYFTPVVIQLVMAIFNFYFVCHAHSLTEAFLANITGYSN